MIKTLLMDSWFFFKNHIVAISMIILPIVVPIDVLTTLYQYFLASDELTISEQLIPMFIGMIAYPIYAVRVVFYIASAISNERIDTKTSWRLGFKFWLPYATMSFFIGLVVMLGLIFLVIPGIIFSVRYSFSEFELLLNKNKSLDAMKNSWDATKDYVWVILGGYLVITFVFYAPYYLISEFLNQESASYWVLDTVLNIVYSVLGALYTIFTFRVYEFAKLQHNTQLNSNDEDSPTK